MRNGIEDEESKLVGIEISSTVGNISGSYKLFERLFPSRMERDSSFLNVALGGISKGAPSLSKRKKLSHRDKQIKQMVAYARDST